MPANPQPDRGMDAELVDRHWPARIAGHDESGTDPRRLHEHSYEPGLVEARQPSLEAGRRLTLVEGVARLCDETGEVLG